MTNIPKAKFREAYRREKDPRVVKRMAAVNMVYYNNESTQHVADSLLQCPNWVLTWVKRFKEGGIEALRDLPRAGRPTKASSKIIKKIMTESTQTRTTPKELQQKIQEDKNVVSYYIRS